MSYDLHRRAHTPRWWVFALVLFVACWAVSLPLYFYLPWWAAIPVGFATGVTLGHAGTTLRRWAWERRHPLRPCGPGCWLRFEGELDQRAETQREVARWQ